ncbi:hypothetical protein BCR44DRAFT_223936 [Catenaria anguillulae PL171]|uniref:Uncharacterized protein n=1 Tax=Catenaria anguillulae PL171 TaxID=765915 RepID=A0A1Y2HYQ1_9FUNG|nr:hypothetical protein BCR44DRAFT_223936 [Catenaria anguillulae PL171]
MQQTNHKTPTHSCRSRSPRTTRKPLHQHQHLPLPCHLPTPRCSPSDSSCTSCVPPSRSRSPAHLATQLPTKPRTSGCKYLVNLLCVPARPLATASFPPRILAVIVNKFVDPLAASEIGGDVGRTLFKFQRAQQGPSESPLCRVHALMDSNYRARVCPGPHRLTSMMARPQPNLYEDPCLPATRLARRCGGVAQRARPLRVAHSFRTSIFAVPCAARQLGRHVGRPQPPGRPIDVASANNEVNMLNW